jgi:hypothetical protein
MQSDRWFRRRNGTHWAELKHIRNSRRKYIFFLAVHFHGFAALSFCSVDRMPCYLMVFFQLQRLRSVEIDGRMVVNDLQEAFCFVVRERHFPGQTEENGVLSGQSINRAKLKLTIAKVRCLITVFTSLYSINYFIRIFCTSASSHFIWVLGSRA